MSEPTIEDRLEILWTQFERQTKAGDPEYLPRIILERHGEVVATAFLSPQEVKHTIPIAMTAFRADVAVFASDAWMLVAPKDTTEDVLHAILDKYGSVSGAFEAGHPWASESFQIGVYYTDGTSAQGHIPYTRRSDHLKRGETRVMDGQSEGRAIPDAETMARVAEAREAMEIFSDRMGIASLGADMSALRVLHRMLDQTWLLLYPYEPAEAEEAMQTLHDIAKDMGYDLE